MNAFHFRFCVFNPQYWDGTNLLPTIEEAFDIKLLRSFTRKQFFDYFDPRLDA